MDLNTITEVAHPQLAQRLWTAAISWLAGGTWLFSDQGPPNAAIRPPPISWRRDRR